MQCLNNHLFRQFFLQDVSYDIATMHSITDRWTDGQTDR